MTREAMARGWAATQLEQVHDDPAGRMALLTRTYGGPLGRATQHLPYRRAATSFMRWQADRGVLAALDADPAGSRWWRAVNDRLLLDGCEAMAYSGGLTGEPSSPTIGAWMSFIARPAARSWYRAHNSSIVSAYLENRHLAEQESRPERFFLNVALLACSTRTHLSGHRVWLSGHSRRWGGLSGIRGWGWPALFCLFAACFPTVTRWTRMSRCISSVSKVSGGCSTTA